MKIRVLIVAGVVLLAALWDNPRLAAQGPLTPPGVPAPTLKTLDQVEPRTPISSIPYTISTPGAYYLTNNLTASGTVGITITTSNVTLDLNGFIISNVNALGGSGILSLGDTATSPYRNIRIRDGFIKGGSTHSGGTYTYGGYQYGINLPNACDVLVSGVTVIACYNEGIFLAGKGTAAEFCTARTIQGVGIYAETIRDSAAVDCGSVAIDAQLVADNCRGDAYGGSSGRGVSGTVSNNCIGVGVDGIGLLATTATGCYGASTSGIGLSALNAATSHGSSNTAVGLTANVVMNCEGYSNQGTGIGAAQTATTSYGSSNSGVGLLAPSAVNCYGVSVGNDGLDATYSAENCYATTTNGQRGLNTINAQNCWANGPTNYGIFATNATNCYAQGDLNGISAGVALSCYATASGGAGVVASKSATNCYGTTSTSAAGIVAQNVAVGCFGVSTASGTGISATVATSCLGSPTNTVTHKYQMP